MRLSQRSRRRNGRRVTRSLTHCLVDVLESRRLFAGETVVSAIPPVLASTASPTTNSFSLGQFFTDATLPGTLVTFSTTLGTIDVALTDAATPNTVANFLSYVNSKAYDNTIYHRSVSLALPGGPGATPENPGTIIQGGGYTINSNGSSSSIDHIATSAPIQDEYAHELFGDIAGTLAMAKTGDANTATSEFFFNVTDNTELDTPTTDSNGMQTSYTVFGQIIAGTQSANVIGNIAKLPTTSLGNGLDTVPVTGLSEAQISAGVAVAPSNLIFNNTVTAQAGTSYNVSSDNKSLVTPTVSNGTVSFAYGTGSGTANITVTAINLDGTTATATFAVTVPDPTTPGAGPVANPVSAPFVVTGKSQTFSVLGPDTDSIAPLDPTKVAIVTGPTHGTATVDPKTGMITYTPDITGTPPYTGSDTLTYTVTDTGGRTSAPATVTLDVVPTAVKVTFGGSSAAKTLTFTEPDGIVGHLSLVGGASAVVTFTDFQVTTAITRGVMTATGAGTIITNITITNSPGRGTGLTVNSNGPVQLGSVNDSQFLAYLSAPNGTLSGLCGFANVGTIKVAAALNANISLGVVSTVNLIIPNVTNTDITGTAIASIQSKQWLITDGAAHTIHATYIGNLKVPGTFDEGLGLTSTGYGLFNANVGPAGGFWGLNGSIFKATLTNPKSVWQLQSNGLVRTLAIKGNLVGTQITAAAITTMTVSGTSDGIVVQTDATFSPKFNQIQKMAFAGNVSNSVIFSAGNIGTITAPSLTNSRIYAGVVIDVAKNGSIAQMTTDLTDNAKIGLISLGRGPAAFANSLISADILNSLQLGKIVASNGGTAEGISAHTIASISATLVPGGLFKPTKANLKNNTTLLAYITAKKLAVGDFKVNLF